MSSSNNFSLDRLNSVDPKLAGQSAMRVIQANEGQPPEHQLIGIALAFFLTCKKYRVHLGSAYNVANNLVDRVIKKVPALGAVKDYVTNEL